jgi:ribonuclease HIII
LNEALLESSQVSSTQPTNQYEAFRLRCAGGTIIGYTSGKVVASGSLAEALLKDTVFAMEDLGRFDSKDLSMHIIMEIDFDIEEHSMARYTVLISPEKFNQRLAELHEEGKNLNDLLAWAHSLAISKVFKTIGPSLASDVQIVVDEFARAKTRERLDRVIDLDSVNLVQRHQAEDEIAVAAASISARAARELWIDGARKSLNIELREISKEEARNHPEKHRFAKTQYIS